MAIQARGRHQFTPMLVSRNETDRTRQLAGREAGQTVVRRYARLSPHVCRNQMAPTILSTDQKSVARPLTSQSPYLTGSFPPRPPFSGGNSAARRSISARRCSASASARLAAGESCRFGADSSGMSSLLILSGHCRLPVVALHIQNSPACCEKNVSGSPRGIATLELDRRMADADRHGVGNPSLPVSAKPQCGSAIE